jgi:hypothetical protein
MRTLIAAGVVAGTLATGLAAPQDPALDAVLAAGRAYVDGYKTRLMAVVLDERYTVIDASTGQMGVPTRVSSDLVLINNAGVPMALRDAYAINGAKIREPEPRIVALLGNPTPENADLVRAYTREAQRYFMAEIVVRMNDPLMALRFMSPEDPSKFTYAIDGRKKMDGVDVVGLRFQENRGEHTKYVLGTRGNAAVAGRFWLEPATGVIHQTEFYVESKAETGRMVVTYAHAKGIDMWVPSKSVETYQEREETGGPTGMGAGGVSRSSKIEANAAYGNPRLMPITSKN